MKEVDESKLNGILGKYFPELALIHKDLKMKYELSPRLLSVSQAVSSRCLIQGMIRESGGDQDSSVQGTEGTPSMTGAFRCLQITVTLLKDINFSAYHAENPNNLMDSACVCSGEFTMRKRRLQRHL